jgi:hypothetical protein
VRILVVVRLTACCAGSVLAAPNLTNSEPSVYLKHTCPQLFEEARALSKGDGRTPPPVCRSNEQSRQMRNT